MSPAKVDDVRLSKSKVGVVADVTTPGRPGPPSRLTERLPLTTVVSLNCLAGVASANAYDAGFFDSETADAAVTVRASVPFFRNSRKPPLASPVWPPLPPRPKSPPPPPPPEPPPKPHL